MTRARHWFLRKMKARCWYGMPASSLVGGPMCPHRFKRSRANGLMSGDGDAPCRISKLERRCRTGNHPLLLGRIPVIFFPKDSEISKRALCGEDPHVPVRWCLVQLAWLPKPPKPPTLPQHLRSVGLTPGDTKAFLLVLKEQLSDAAFAGHHSLRTVKAWILTPPFYELSSTAMAYERFCSGTGWATRAE